ncbi:MAG TPA: AMP-binding protein, partial [Pseudorhodoferax sp.]|nr:AMP-binding protein [Pseudorhodoferax sp.]
PIPGIEIRLLDAQRMPVPHGEVGELWARGPNVMRGYYRDPERTRELIDAEDWFNTGDLARQGEDGALHIAGRSKELIIRSGFNVYPLEVEQALNSFPGVLQSAVVGRTVGHNEEVVAYVEMTPGQPLDEAALRLHLRERLSPYKQPADIHVLAQLPAAPTGKVLKGRLKQMAAGELPISP